MGLKIIKQFGLILVALSLTALSRSQKIPNIHNLYCLNDYQRNMLCFWEVASNSSCSEDFALTYTDFQGKEEKCLDLQNEQSSVSALPNKCICNITVDVFVYSDYYLIKVGSRGQPVANTTIYIRSTVKPRAPSNVRVEFEKQNGLVQWNTNYEHNFIQSKLSFHVQILLKHNRNVAKEDFLTRLEPRYRFNKRQLRRGEDYVIRVRTKPAELQGFQGTWSDWSSEAEWNNDYSLSFLEMKNTVIPVICIVMLLLIILSYVCLTRYKKIWWNNIPNPAKSKLAQSSLLQKHSLNSDGKSTAKSSCGSILSRIVKAQKSKCDQLTQQHDSKAYGNISGGYNYKKLFFEPEYQDIERCVKMYPKKENDDSIQEEKLEHNPENHLLEGDLSIAKMFFDILCDSSGIKVETCKNSHMGTSFGCSGWMDSFGKKETQWCNSDVSAYRESGYDSYGSDDSPLDFLSEIDAVNTSYFGQLSDNKEHCISYTPQANAKKDCLYHEKEANLQCSGYSSFANALTDERKDLIIDISKSSISKNVLLCDINSHQRLRTPKSILYYNTKDLFSHKDNVQSSIRPKSEQVSEFKLHGYESKNDPTSICPESGYQSFNQAVQENNQEFVCHMSGYKSFDQAVHEGGPDSGFQVLGYQSFDQAVHEGGPDCGCQVLGYQSFDQAVQEADVCQGVGYQSFDHAVQQSEISESTNSSAVEPGYTTLEDPISPKKDYSVEDMSENGRQNQLGDSHCQKNTDSSQTEFVTNANNKKTINGQKHEPLSLGLKQFCLEDIIHLTKGKYNFSKNVSTKSLKALKIAVDTHLENDLAATHKSAPFTLTFDICEHLRNLENMHAHKASLNSMILPGHLDEVQIDQEQLNLHKYLTRPKFPPTKSDNFENLSYFINLCDLETLGSNQQNKHLLIQQMNEDKDGNSYMKLALTLQGNKVKQNLVVIPTQPIIP